MGYAELHQHSQASVLDGLGPIAKRVKRAVQLGYPAIAITDHGVMSSAPDLFDACKGTNVKPIAGCELYVINGTLEEAHQKKGRVRKYHLTVWAKNFQGYKSLVALNSIAHTKGRLGNGIMARPCVTKDLLEKHSDGLMVASGCLGGEMAQAILNDRPDVARKLALWGRRIWKDDYYLEIQDHALAEERLVNPFLMQLSEELGIKAVATNDVHYCTAEDVDAHDAVICIQTQKQVSEEKRLRYSGTEFLKSEEQMLSLFRDHLPEGFVRAAIDETVNIAEKVEVYSIFGPPKMPIFDCPVGFNSASYMGKIAWDGLCDRLEISNKADCPQEYRDRLERELLLLRDKGFSDYFLVVWDYIKFARDRGIRVGPGRGSAAGSLVAYAMGITDIDPIEWGLIFERFLNPERESLPDIDTDFCIERRQEVIDYVTEKYGTDYVAQIGTVNTMAAKAAIKDTGRVLGIAYDVCSEMSDRIVSKRGKTQTVGDLIESGVTDYENDRLLPSKDGGTVSCRKWLDMAAAIEGNLKSYGVHAAGVIISGIPIREIVPVMTNSDGAVFTQYNMNYVERCGLIKMDFLGLANLTTIDEALRLIKVSTGQVIDISKIDKTDRNVFEFISHGKLMGVFQLESTGIGSLVLSMAPSDMNDLSAILALYRPGPLDNGMHTRYVNRKKGVEPIECDHPTLEPILRDTYGVMVYQEQVMAIAQKLAGYSAGQADMLRRAMGKKKPEVMQKERERFVDGAMRNGVSREIAELIFGNILAFAEYGFNRSHSQAYAEVTFQTAWLATYYPAEFRAALLSVAGGDSAKLSKHIGFCKSVNVDVLPPDINVSGEKFSVEDGKVRIGFCGVKSFGGTMIPAVLDERDRNGPFTSLRNLCTRVPGIDKTALEALASCGALDSFGLSRRAIIEQGPTLLKWSKNENKSAAKGQMSLLGLMEAAEVEAIAPAIQNCPEFGLMERLRREKEVAGLYLSGHPLDAIASDVPHLTEEDFNPEESEVGDAWIVGIVSGFKEVVTKKGDAMATMTIEGLNGSIRAVVFPKSFRLYREAFTSPVVIVFGKFEKKDGELQLIISDAFCAQSTQITEIQVDCSKLREGDREAIRYAVQRAEQRIDYGAGAKAFAPVAVKTIFESGASFSRFLPISSAYHEPELVAEAFKGLNCKCDRHSLIQAAA